MGGLVARGIERVVPALSPDGKELRALNNRLTWVLKNTSSGWKVVHEHTSAPVNHETGKVILNR